MSYGISCEGIGFESTSPWMLSSVSFSQANHAPPVSLIFNELGLSHLGNTSPSCEVLKTCFESTPSHWQTIYFKKCNANYPPKLAQIEAAISASYRMIQGDFIAQILPVVDLSGKVIGAVSYGSSSFRLMDAQAFAEELAEKIISRFVWAEEEQQMVCADENYSLDQLLLNLALHMKSLELHFSLNEEGKEAYNELKSAIEAEWNEFEERLVTSSTFRKYILTDEMAFQNCRARLANEKVEGMPFDIEEKLLMIIKRCMLKDVVMAIYDFGLQPDSNYLCDELIAIFDAFEQSPIPLQELFPALENWWNRENYTQIQPFQTIIDSYKKTIFSEFSMPLQREALQCAKKVLSLFNKNELDAVKCLAIIVKKFVENDSSQPKLLSIFQNCLERYRPMGHGTKYENWNPMAYFRTRTTEIETLSTTQQKVSLSDIIEFLSKGSWYQTGYLREASANVMLLTQTCLAALDHYKKELTLTQLKEQAFVEICYSMERKELNIEQSAQNIYEQLKQLIASEQQVNPQIF